MSRSLSIVGANSFLARNFYYYLKHIVHANMSHVYLYDLQDCHADDEDHYFQIDFTDETSLRSIRFDVDAIYFFSGITGTVNGFDRYDDFININNTVLLRFLNLCRQIEKPPLIVYPSSRLIYKENRFDKVKETDEKELKSVYAITKYAAEEYIRLYANAFKLKYCILRICTPYGSLIHSDGHYGTFKFFSEQAVKQGYITLYGSGKDRKTYTHIYDICSILQKPMQYPQMVNETFNVGGSTMSLLQIAQLIARAHRARIEHVEWPLLAKKVDGGNVVFDSAKLDQIIHYHYRRIDQ